MRHCPECGSEFQDWVRTCVDCGAGLKDGPPPERPLTEVPEPQEEDIQFDGDFTTVAAFNNEIEAKLYQSILESEDIASYIFSEQLIYGSENCVGAVKLRVKAPEAEKALEIIKEVIKENSESEKDGSPAGDEDSSRLEETSVSEEETSGSADETEYLESQEEEAEEAEEEEVPEEKVRCPLCGSTNLQRSGPGILRAFGRGKMKCRRCSHSW